MEYLVCRKVYKQVPLLIQDMLLMEDLYVLAMEGENIVIDIQWLENFGEVTINYKKLIIKFRHDGKHVCWQGDTPLVKSQISENSLQRLMG